MDTFDFGYEILNQLSGIKSRNATFGFNFNYDYDLDPDVLKNTNESTEDKILMYERNYERNKIIMKNALNYIKRKDLDNEVLNLNVKNYFDIKYQEMIKVFNIYLFIIILLIIMLYLIILFIIIMGLF